MFEFSPLFWYKLIFMAELQIAEWMFAFCLKKRPRYALRFILSVSGCFLFAFLFPVLYYNALYSSFIFFCFFAVSLLAMRFCFRGPWVNILFCGLAAYTAQHIAYSMYDFFNVVFDLGTAGIYGLYGSEPMEFDALNAVVYIDCYFLSYWILLLVFGSRMDREDDLAVRNIFFLFLALAIVVLDIVFNAIIVYYSYERYDRFYIIMLYIYNITSCILALIIQFGMVSHKNIKNKLEVIQSLWEEEKREYQITKESMEKINLLCHDLKHQIHRYNTGEEKVDQGFARSIENIVSVYDTKVETGNEALDVILTEKSIFCCNNGIRLTCMADGEKLRFMSETDLYSLFGNALDNAIEAVARVAEQEKRVIGLVIKANGALLSVNIRNYFEDGIVFKKGLPVTTKKGERHGFGMKSIQLITEKYDGTLSVVAKDHVFDLNILFLLPLPQEFEGINEV